MIDLILNHDALVTLGGMSAYEAMTLGTPVCGVEWSYLAYVVRSFAELKMINNLGDIKNAYENLLNLNLLLFLFILLHYLFIIKFIIKQTP